MNREEAWAEIHALYEALPEIQCKGLCYDTCTSINPSELEREAVRARGVELPPGIGHQRHLQLIAAGQTPRCPALSALNTCSVYDVRPYICRVYGSIRTDGCEHGCWSSEWFEAEDVTRVMMRIEMISREVTGVTWIGGQRRKL